MERGQKPEGFSPPVEPHKPSSAERRPQTETAPRPKRPEKPATKEKASKPAEKPASKQPVKRDLFDLLGIPEQRPKESSKLGELPLPALPPESPVRSERQSPQTEVEVPQQLETPEQKTAQEYLHVADQFHQVGTSVLGLLEQTAETVRHARPTEPREQQSQLQDIETAHAELGETLEDLDEATEDLRAYVEAVPLAVETSNLHRELAADAADHDAESTPEADYDGGDAALHQPPPTARREHMMNLEQELAHTQRALEKTDRKARHARALSVGVGAVTAFELYRTHKLKKEVKGLRKEQRAEHNMLQEQRELLGDQRDQLAQQSAELHRLYQNQTEVRRAEPARRQAHVAEAVQFAQRQAVTTETFSQELRDHQERVAHRAVVVSQQREKLKKMERVKTEKPVEDRPQRLPEQKLGLAAAEVTGARLVMERPKPKNAEQLPKPTVQVERAERTEFGPAQRPMHQHVMQSSLGQAGDESVRTSQNATNSQKIANDLTLSVEQQLRQKQLQKAQTRHSQPWLLGLSLLAGAILLFLIVATILQR